MRTPIKQLNTEYLRPDETVEIIEYDDGSYIFVHFKNGYYSLIDSVQHLHEFLSGDTDARFACTPYEDELLTFINQL